MSFTEQSRRQPALDGTLIEPQPGDLCFVHYHKMKQTWNASPRRTTVHAIRRTMGRDYIRLTEDSVRPCLAGILRPSRTTVRGKEAEGEWGR